MWWEKSDTQITKLVSWSPQPETTGRVYRACRPPTDNVNFKQHPLRKSQTIHGRSRSKAPFRVNSMRRQLGSHDPDERAPTTRPVTNKGHKEATHTQHKTRNTELTLLHSFISWQQAPGNVATGKCGHWEMWPPGNVATGKCGNLSFYKLAASTAHWEMWPRKIRTQHSAKVATTQCAHQMGLPDER